MWLYDTGEQQAIHVEGVEKSTVLDAFLYPLIAIRQTVRDGRLCHEVQGGNVVTTETITRKRHLGKKTA